MTISFLQKERKGLEQLSKLNPFVSDEVALFIKSSINVILGFELGKKFPKV